MVSVFTFCDLRNSTAKFLFTLIFTDFSPLKNIFLTSLLPTWYSICHFIAHLLHLYTSLCQHLAPSSELPYQEMWKQTQRFEHRMWWCYCVSLLPNLNSYGLTLIIVIRKYKVSMIFVQHKFLPSKGLDHEHTHKKTFVIILQAHIKAVMVDYCQTEWTKQANCSELITPRQILIPNSLSTWRYLIKEKLGSQLGSFNRSVGVLFSCPIPVNAMSHARYHSLGGWFTKRTMRIKAYAFRQKGRKWKKSQRHAGL